MEKEYTANISLEEYEKLNDVEKREYYERTVDDYLEKQDISKEKYDKELENCGFSEKEGYYRNAFLGLPDPEMYNPNLSPEGRDNARGFIERQRDQEREERESKVAFSKYNAERDLYIKETGITDKQYQEQCEKGQLKLGGYNRCEYEHPELVPSSERFNPWLSQEAKEQIREINKDKIKEQERQREQDKEKRQQERKEEIKKYTKEKNKYCRDNNISFKEYDRNVAIGGNLMPSSEQYNPDRSKEEREDIANRDIWKGREAEKAAYEKEVADYLKETGMSKKDYTYQCTHAESPRDYPGPEHKNLNHYHIRDEIKNRDMVAEREFEKQYQKEHKDDKFKDDGERQTALKQKISDRIDYVYDKENERYEQEKEQWCRENNVSYREYDFLRSQDIDFVPYPERLEPERSVSEKEYIQDRGDNIWGKEEHKIAYEREVSDYLRETGMSREDYTYQCINSKNPNELPVPERSNAAHSIDSKIQLRRKDPEIEKEFERKYQQEHRNDKFKDDKERQQALRDKQKERSEFIKEKEVDKEYEKYNKEVEKYCKENNISHSEYRGLNRSDPEFLPYPERLNPERTDEQRRELEERGPGYTWEGKEAEKIIYERAVSNYLKETGMSRDDYNYQCLNATKVADYPAPERFNTMHGLPVKAGMKQRDPEVDKEFEKKYQQEHKNDRFNDDKERLQALKNKSKERDAFVKEKEYEKYHKEVDKYCRENNMSPKEYEVNVKIGGLMTPKAEQYNPDKTQSEREFAKEHDVWKELHGDKANVAKAEYEKGVDDYLKKTGMSREDYNYQCINSNGSNGLPKPELKNANHWLDRYFEQRNLRDEIKFEKQYQKDHKNDRFNDDKERQEALKEKIKERDQYLKDREQARERNPIEQIREKINGIRDNIQDRIQDFQRQREEKESREQGRMEEKRAERRYEKDVKAFCKEHDIDRKTYDSFRMDDRYKDVLAPEINSPKCSALERSERLNAYAQEINRDINSDLRGSLTNHVQLIKEMDRTYERTVTEYCRENNIERADYNTMAKQTPELCPPEQLNRNQPLEVRENIMAREEQRVHEERAVIIKENLARQETQRGHEERGISNTPEQNRDKTQEIYHNLYERGVEKYCDEHSIENRDDYNNHIANLEREGKALPEHEALNNNRSQEERMYIIEQNREQQKGHEEKDRDIEKDHSERLAQERACPAR